MKEEEIKKPVVDEASNGRFWLGIWMVTNISLTLMNKAVFTKVDFKYPYYLSFIHMVCNAIGAEIFLRSKGIGGSIPRTELDRKGHLCILAYSVIFSLNIAIGNVSLRHVSVNFNQVMRSLVPALTIALCLCLGKRFSMQRMLSIIPIIIGVAMACFGDMSYTAIGLTYTLLCVFLAAFKVISSNYILTGKLKLEPIELLSHMAPLAMIQCLFLALISGEVKAIAARWDTELNPALNPFPFIMLMSNGALSFFLNICSLKANKLTSPLTMCIAANVKQVLMIIISTVVFSTEINLLNGSGITLVLFSGALYSYICLTENEKEKAKKLNVIEKLEEGGPEKPETKQVA